MESPYDDEFLEETADFMNYFHTSPYTPHKNQSCYYTWKINNNPYGLGNILIDRRDDKIVNAITITPKRVAVSGNVSKACELGELLTHPDYRGKSLYIRALKNAVGWSVDNDIEVIFGTPNKYSMAGAIKFAKFEIYPFGKVVELTKHIAGLRQLLNYFKPQKEGRREAIKSLLESYSRQRSISDTKRVGTCQVHRYSDKPIDITLNGLWADSRQDFGFFMFRDENYLNWRFFDNPDDYDIFIAESSGEVVGYIVTKITLDHGVKVGTICDFISRNDDPEIFRQLLLAAEDHLTKEVVRHIRVWCIDNSPYYSQIVSSGYAEGVNRPIVINSMTEAGNGVLHNESNMHFTMADCDHI